MQPVRAMVLDEPGPPLRAPSCRTRATRRPARCSSRSTPAACAAPTCTSATARCAARGCRSCPATRSSPPCSRRAGADHAPGARVGIPWLGWTDGTAASAERAREPLRARPVHGPRPRRRLRDARRGRRPLRLAAARGLRRPRGRAAAVRRADRPPRAAHDRRRAAARALRLRRRAHIVCQVALHQGRRVFAFTRADDRRRRPSRSSSAASGPATRWARRPRSSTRRSSSPPSASSCPRRCGRWGAGGVVVCAGIHMSDIPSFPYEMLWGERVLRSVANLTRADATSSWTSRRACRCART